MDKSYNVVQARPGRKKYMSRIMVAGILACVLGFGTIIPAEAAISDGSIDVTTGGQLWSYLHNTSISSSHFNYAKETSLYSYLAAIGGATLALGADASVFNGSYYDTHLNQYGLSTGSGPDAGGVAIGKGVRGDSPGVAIGINSKQGIYNGMGSKVAGYMMGGPGTSVTNNNIAISGGNGTAVAEDDGLAIGDSVVAKTSKNSSSYSTFYAMNTVIGFDSISDSENATVIGRGNTMGDGTAETGRMSHTLGFGNTVNGNHSAAVGNYITVTGHNTVVLGGGYKSRDNNVVSYDTGESESNNANVVSGSNSVVLGVGSDGTQNEVVSVGNTDYTRRIVFVGDGTSWKEAATVGQTVELVAGDNIELVDDGVSAIGKKKYKINAVDGGSNYTNGKGITISNDDVIATKNVVMYDADSNETATLAGTRGTKLSHLKAAKLNVDSSDAVIGNQLWATNQNVAGLQSNITINKDNIASLNTSVTNVLESVSTVNNLVDVVNSLKSDVSLNNLDDNGRLVIKNAAENAVQEYMAARNKMVSNNKMMVSLNEVVPDDLKADISYVDEQLDTKADKDALNLKADISYVDGQLGSKADKGFVYSKEEFDAKLDAKADAGYVKEQLDAKADVSSVYLKQDVDNMLANKANVSDVSLKADVDAFNIETDAWVEKLGIQANDLVSVDNDVISVGSKYDDVDSVSIKKSDGVGRVLSGVTVNPMDNTSAVNVGYVNAVAEGVINGLQPSVQHLGDKVDKIGAKSAALAGLHPFDNDGDQKWNVAAAYGGYKSEKAAALGVFYKPQSNVMVSVGSSVGGSENIYNVGVTFALDKGNVGVSQSEIAKKLDDALTVVAQQERRIAQRDARIMQLNAKVKERAKK